MNPFAGFNIFTLLGIDEKGLRNLMIRLGEITLGGLFLIVGFWTIIGGIPKVQGAAKVVGSTAAGAIAGPEGAVMGAGAGMAAAKEDFAEGAE